MAHINESEIELRTELEQAKDTNAILMAKMQALEMQIKMIQDERDRMFVRIPKNKSWPTVWLTAQKSTKV